MVILQGFYWNCLENWWEHLEYLAEEIANKGFDTVWLPPVSKGMNGSNSMGYDIKEHYNLDSRFGTKETLKKLINKLHKEDVNVMADLVLGHMLGGELEYNPYFDKKTYTKFEDELFKKNYRHFCHECGNCDSRNSFGETICYSSDDKYMADGLINWAKWLKDEIGFDSFRLDNIKDMRWDFTKVFTQYFKLDTFMMGEYWEGADSKLNEVHSYNPDLNLLNFPLFYKLRDMCMNPDFDIRKLEEINKNKRVNFLANHDIERRERSSNKDAISEKKELAYAYIFFQDNPVVVFWDDYFRYELKDQIDTLIGVKKETEKEGLEIIKSTCNIYHAKRGCYELIINNGGNAEMVQGFKIEPRSYIILNGGDKL